MDFNTKKSYKYCIVPLCKNTTISKPDKIFFNVPRTADIRRKWCQVIGRDETEGSSLSERTSLYCCEDHFNLKEDTDNYMEYRIMHNLEGRQVSLRLRKGALPHIFQCTKTEDDIDIEEHDVLENPAIRSIFPDMTVLKEEMETYQEGLEQGLTHTATTSIDEIKFNYTVKLENTTDSLDDYDSVTNDIRSMQSESLTEVGNCDVENRQSTNVLAIDKNSNRMSCSSETSEETFDTCPKLFDAFVQLVDQMPYLESSKRYCGDCKILFPATRAMEVHNYIKHACLPNLNPAENFKCSTCNRCFTSTRGLGYHMSKVHPENRETFKADKIAAKRVTKFPCVHCNKSFPTQEYLIDHLYEVLQSKKSTETDQIEIHRNEKLRHVKEIHKNTKVAKTIKTIRSKSKVDYYFRCFICSFYFKSMLGLKNHLALNHQMSFTSVESKYKSKTAFTGRCKHCPVTLRDLIKHNHHVKKYHNDSYNSTIIYNLNKKSTRKDFKLNDPPQSESEESMQNFQEQDGKPMRSSTEFPSKKSMKIARVVLINNDLSALNNCIPIKSGVSKTNNKLKRKIDMKLTVPVSKKRARVTKVLKKNETANPMRNTKQTESQGEKSMEITLVLKKTLFKCTECDIHFLSAKAAMNHEHHAVEQLDSWKCETCMRVFKDNDKLVHEKHHLFCNVHEYTVYELNSSELSRVLYVCPKCDIHLTEDNFMSHYPVCGLDTLKSYYCDVCDISIDNAIGKSHETSHLNQNLNASDFTIVKTEVLLSNNGNSKDSRTTDVNHATSMKSPKGKKSNNSSNNLILKRKIQKSTVPLSEKKKNLKHLLKMFYCKTCKCYLTVANASKHKEHGVQKWICKRCGLVLPINSCAHRRLHLKFTDLKLQDFDFYEFRSKKHILPPIPEYFKCDVCDVNYISKATHECSDENYLTCHVCEIKLSEEAFKLHLYFHNYFRANIKIESVKEPTVQMLQEKSLNLNSTADCLTESENSTSRVRAIIYCCRNCFVAVDSYDKVVEHCQEHYSPTRILIKTKECELCNLKFDHRCYDSHRELHFSKSAKIVFDLLKFDTFYFTSENQIWVQNVLGSLPKKQMDEILSKSIYQYECRIRMEVIQEGTSYLTMYKCYKCGCFINYPSIYRHAEYSCFKLRKHPCSVCGLPFMSSFARLEHEKIHQNKIDICSKSYRIVTFNREEDKAYNALISRGYYALYQCRNCDVSIDKSQVSSHECRRMDLKKCINCGLLLYNDDYKQHVLRHKDLVNFTHKKMKVMLFGKKVEELASSKELSPSFKGIVCDLTLYSCKKCQLCVENIKWKHVCSPPRAICSICGLHFPPSKLKNHRLVHDFDSDYVKENMIIITFDFERNEVVSSNLVEKEYFVDDSEIVEEETCEDVVEEASPAADKKSVEELQIIEEETSENIIEEASSAIHLQNVDSSKMIEQNTTNKVVEEASSATDKQTADDFEMIEQNISENVVAEALPASGKKTAYDSKMIEDNTSKKVFVEETPATDEQTANYSEMIKQNTSEIVVEASPASDEQAVHNYEMIEQNTSEIVDASPGTDGQTTEKSEMIEQNTSEDVAGTSRATDENTSDDSKMIQANSCKNLVENSFSSIDGNTVGSSKKDKASIRNKKNLDPQITENNMSSQNADEGSNSIATLYKCTCGLHFLDEPSISIHFELCSPKIRTSRQTCSKCNLSFTPNILFSHFILHHGDKNNIFKYNIVDMAKKSKQTQDYYKCFKCNLYFVTETKASEHFEKCGLDSRTRQIGTLCDVCHLTFDASSSSIHGHTYDKNGQIYYQVISVDGGVTSRDKSAEILTYAHKSVVTQQEVVESMSSKMSNFNDCDKTIYKCKDCGIHYLSKALMRSHHQKKKQERKQHVLPTLQDICTVCGLNFYALSLTKHIANHHVKCNLKLNDLIIEECGAEDF